METTVAAKASSPDDGYADYVPTATDPDWWFTVYIVAGCLLINLSLPLWIYLGKCCGFNERSRDRRRKSKATGWENQNVNFDNDNDNNCDDDDVDMQDKNMISVDKDNGNDNDVCATTTTTTMMSHNVL
mmetsp:Transcript_47298/g.51079  ORF Transcript_47298/g.51079 Transcript_47298/m.51079 type:complete len:129 (-) Transcript_47298:229-615(-)